MRAKKALKNGVVIYRVTGDEDPISYGGGVVYETPRGDFFWEFWSAPDEHDMTYVYRVGIPKDVLSVYDFMTRSEMSHAMGVSRTEIRRMSRSVSLEERFDLIMHAVDMYGPSSFSPCKQWEIDKVRDRWGEAFSKPSKSRYTSKNQDAERTLRKMRGRAISRRL